MTVMADYQYRTSFGIRYDLNLMRYADEGIRYDSISDLRYEGCLIQHDLKPFHFYLKAILFDSDSYDGFLKSNGLFDARSMQYNMLPQRIDASSYQSSGQFRFDYDFLILQKNGIPQEWDIVDFWNGQRKSKFLWVNDLIVAKKERLFSSFDSFSIDSRTRLSYALDSFFLLRERIASRWNAIPCDFLARQNGLFNAICWQRYAIPIHRQSLVCPGWSILARNINTENVRQLGFIHADSHDRSLADIDLPDGEYEIFVRTSSHYWLDAFDHRIRTVVIGEEEEIVPLPSIYNLRSVVQNGVRIIQWSAGRSEALDCLFGVWYSSESPVDTDRPPDATIWYSAAMTEYQTSFDQNAPAFVAVAAIQPGNESRRGKFHELHLHWDTTIPGAPDDVIVLAEPLPVFDTTMNERSVHNENATIW